MFIYTIGSLTYYYRTKQPEKGHIWREMLKHMDVNPFFAGNVFCKIADELAFYISRYVD